MSKEIIFPGQDDAAVAEWVASQLGQPGKDWGKPKAFGVLEDGKLIGGVVMNYYSGHDIVLHVASTTPRWLDRRLLRHIFHYVFEVCGCIRATSVVDKSNKHVLKFDIDLGFTPEGTLRSGGTDGKDDLIVFGMLKSECKWLDKEPIDG